jgi:hypothetical protein
MSADHVLLRLLPSVPFYHYSIFICLSAGEGRVYAKVIRTLLSTKKKKKNLLIRDHIVTHYL